MSYIKIYMKVYQRVNSLSVPGCLKDQPPASSRRLDIIIYSQIEILTVKDQYVDIYEVL